MWVYSLSVQWVEKGGSCRWSRGWGSRESSGWSRGWGSRGSRGLSSGWGSWDTKRLTWIPTGYVTSSLRTQTRAQTAVRGVQVVLGNNSVMRQRSVHPGLETHCRYCTHQASSTSSSRVCRTRDWRSCGDLRPQWWSGHRVLSVSNREVERGQVMSECEQVRRAYRRECQC